MSRAEIPKMLGRARLRAVVDRPQSLGILLPHFLLGHGHRRKRSPTEARHNGDHLEDGEAGPAYVESLLTEAVELVDAGKQRAAFLVAWSAVDKPEAYSRPA